MGNLKIIKDLLGLSFSLQEFIDRGKEFSPSIVNRNIQKLNNIKSGISIQVPDLPIVEDIILRIEKFHNQGVSPSNAELSKNDIRVLSFAFLQKCDTEFVEYIGSILDYNWNKRLLDGIIYSLLKNWYTINKGIFDYTKSFISSHPYSVYNNIIKYITSYNGPYKLGNELRTQNRDIYEVINLFNLANQSYITLPYFSDVLIAYYDHEYNIEKIKDTLNLHNNSRTNKIVIPRLIISNYKNGKITQEVLDYTLEVIGDPEIPSFWAPFDGATNEEVENLKIAKDIIIKTIASRFINIFFNTLCQDKQRNAFWLRHINKISDFTVYGNASAIYRLRSTNLPTPIINRHFRSFGQETQNSTCGLVLKIGKYTMVEFSDVGALYAYKNGSKYYNQVFSQSIQRIDNLKLTYLGLLVVLNTYGDMYFYDEGKMHHRGNWTHRLEMWFIKRGIR